MSASPEPLFDRIAAWATTTVAPGLAAGLLSLAMIGGSSYILYGAQEDFDKVEAVIVDMAARSAPFRLATEMSTIYTDGWLAPKAGNTNKLLDAVRTLQQKRSDSDLDEEWAKATVAFCTEATIQLESEQSRINSFVFGDEFLKRQQALLSSAYSATTKIADSVRRSILQWHEIQPRPGSARDLNIEMPAREFLIASEGIKGLSSLVGSYLSPVIEQDRIKKEQASHTLQMVRTKYMLIAAGFIAGVLLLVATITIHIKRVSHLKRSH
jgi:hypothetical protein